MRTKMLFVALVLAAGVPPVSALPGPAQAYVGAGHLAELWQTDGSPTELRLWAAGWVDATLEEGPATHIDGCLELFRDNIFESGCGLGLSSTAPLVEAQVTGVVATDVWEYVPETVEFIYHGQGEVEVDLTLTAEGAPRPAEPEGTGIGVCGLPPDIPTGGFVQAWAPLERDVSVDGEVASSTLGSVDLAFVAGELSHVVFGFAGGCL